MISKDKNIVFISCKVDGFRYLYYDVSDPDIRNQSDDREDWWYEYNWDDSRQIHSKAKYITGNSGPLFNEIEFRIVGDNINEAILVNEIEYNETYDKIISSDFEIEIEGNGNLYAETILFQYQQKGGYKFEPLELDRNEKFDLKNLTAELIIPVGDLVTSACIKYLIYKKNNGNKIKLGTMEGNYNENDWEPVLSTYDEEIEHYAEKLSTKQFYHSKLLFGDNPEEFLKDFDDLPYVDVVGPIVSDARFPLSFLNAMFQIGIEIWLKENIAKEVLDGFKSNPNASDDLINDFEIRIENENKK